MLKVESYEPDAAALLERCLKLPHLVARILAIRGLNTVEEAERFLHPAWSTSPILFCSPT